MKKYLYLSIFVFLGLVSIGLLAQDEYIYGKVTDKDDKPLANVEVKNRYSGNFTLTDSLGNYRFYLKAKRMNLMEFSIEGRETVVEEFYLREGDKREINITFFDSEGDIITCKPPKPPKNPHYTKKRYNPQILENSLPSMIKSTDIKDYRLLVERK